MRPAPGERLRDCAAIAAAAVLFVLLVRPFQNTPFVDDWVYAWSVEHLLHTGRLAILDLSSNINVTQVLWAALISAPTGFSYGSLGVSTWLLAVAGVGGLYLLHRELDVPRRESLFGAAALGVYPVFAMLGVTFMTDVPFVSLTVLASAAFCRAVRTRRSRWLIAAVIMASLAAGTRMTAVVTPLAMSLALLCSGDPWGRQRARWLWATAPLAAFGGLLWWYPSHVEHVADVTWIANTPAWRISMLPYALPLLPKMLAETFVLALGVLGMALLPLAVACARREVLPRAAVIGAALVAAVAAIRLLGMEPALPLETGQTWAFNELGGNAGLVPGAQGPDVPVPVSWVATIAGACSLAVLASVAAGALARHAAGLFLLFAVTGHLALVALLWLIHDHYLLVVVPCAIALVLAARPQLAWRRGIATLAVFAVVSMAGIRDELRYTAAVWHGVDALRRIGAADRDIDGGYTVNGWLQYAHPDRAYRDAAGNVAVPGVNASTDDRPFKIANTPIPGWRVLATFGHDAWIGPKLPVYVLEKPETQELHR